MKKRNLLILSAALLSMTSCLKDGPVNLAPGASPAVVEWETAIVDDIPSNGAYSRSFQIAAALPMTVMVDYTGGDVAPADITVNLGVSTTAYNAYLAKYPTVYNATTNPQLPAAAYTLPASVVIKKGTRNTLVTLSINSTVFDLTKVYILPLSITSVSSGTVSGNFGNIIYFVNAKNAYDADYAGTGFFFHPTSGSERAIGKTQHMYSAGLNTSYVEFGDLGSSGYQFQYDVAATLSNYSARGATPAAPASGFFTADNPGGLPYNSTVTADRPGTAPWVQATYNNTYNSTTKTFYFHVGYASGGNGQNSWSRQVYQKDVRSN